LTKAANLGPVVGWNPQRLRLILAAQGPARLYRRAVFLQRNFSPITVPFALRLNTPAPI
jgi:hypothetical protein